MKTVAYFLIIMAMLLLMMASWLPINAGAAGLMTGPVPGVQIEPNSGGNINIPLPSGKISVLPSSQEQSSQTADNAAIMKSNVFGSNLFTGAFGRSGSGLFNPDYVIATGDQVQVRFWGAFYYDAILTVDPQGNIFLPNIGPVSIRGVRNQELQKVIESTAAKFYRTNVYCYASLASAQPVRIFVAGFVRKPGLYDGTSMDSILHYLDLAGGIDPDRGTFLQIQVKRGENIRATINLYDFLLNGQMPFIQLFDGDIIFVPHRKKTLTVTGAVDNAYQIEFDGDAKTVADIAKIAKPHPRATHVRVIRNMGTVVNTEYYPITEAGNIIVQDGDEIEFTADQRVGMITVRVEGEHQSAQEYTLPRGARFGDLIKQIEFNDRSDIKNIQLFRRSVRERQKAMFATALRSLESSVLTARSATSDEARLRKDEADLILRWIDKARTIEPSGQVVIAKEKERENLLLENGDIVKIPAKDGIVLINGEVLFPTSVLYGKKTGVVDYVKQAGGFTQNAETSRIIIAHRDGTFDEYRGPSLFGSNPVRAGDEILVLPKIDVKSLQIVKDLSQILFQIAVTAKTVVGL